MAEFAIGNRTVGDGHPPLVICEIGVNHCGSAPLAMQMIAAAASAGAECIKLQSHIPAAEQTEGVPERVRQTIERCALTEAEERKLKAFAEDLGLIFLSTPFSIEAADRLQAMGVPGFKIGSGELTNLPLLERVASFGKPVILSTGMGNNKEIDGAFEALQGAGCDDVALLHCVSMYPTPPGEARLKDMMRLGLEFADGHAVVGISDHSKGIAIPIAAAALDACIIEKHFTLSHDMHTPDAAVSACPQELRQLISGVRDAWEASRQKPEHYVGMWTRFGPSAPELEVAAWARHSVTLTRPVTAGEALTPEHLTTKRPGTGIPAARLRECIGKRAARDMPTNYQPKERDLV